MTQRSRYLLSATLLAGLLASEGALASPVYSLVGTIPLNVGASQFTGYDLSIVDPTTQLYYLTDRSAGAIDVISTQTNKLVERIGAGSNLFGGVSTGNDTAGPNGISITTLADDSKLLLAGNTQPGTTVGNVIAFNLASNGLAVTNTRTLTTNTPSTPVPANRVDGVAYSPQTNTILAANNASTPGAITIVDNGTGAVVKTLLLNGQNGLPNGQGNGVEGPIYNTLTHTFMVAIPNLTSDAQGNGTGGGGILEINPANGDVIRTFSFDALGAPVGCNPNGIVQGANGLIGIACGNSGTLGNPGLTLFLDPAGNDGAGKLTYSSAVTGADQIAYDSSRDLFVEAARFALPDGAGGRTPVVGIFDGFGNYLQSLAATNNIHSIAVDPVSGEILVAEGATGKTPSTSTVEGCSFGCVAVFAPVPEPTSISLLAVGFIGLGAVSRRRSRMPS
ncbi:MAG: PEP-CTERM sorting domain-containing protein [Acetobacteraceae bacterium]|nr:PEP-CTERM sorting domain-containing protein [Acetobacteraceae bacterium]